MELSCKDLAMLYKQGKFQECKASIRELLAKETKLHHSSEDNQIHAWIMHNNGLMCEYMDILTNKTIQNDSYIMLNESWHIFIKEWIYKSNKFTYVDFILINNVLHCSSLFFYKNLQENFIVDENISSVVVALKKILSLHSGVIFKPPISIKLENPSYEMVELIKDIAKTLPIFSTTYRVFLASSLVLILQILLAAKHSHLHRVWTMALNKLSFHSSDLIQLLERKESTVSKADYRVNEATGEYDEMEVDCVAHSTVAMEQTTETIKEKIPIFTCNLFGEAIIYQNSRQELSKERDVYTHLVFLTYLINHVCDQGHVDMESPLFTNKEKISNELILNAWRYLKGYLLFKNGRLNDAKIEMDGLELSSFSSHLKTKKALLIATILSKEEKHHLALTFLNTDAMVCHHCLPTTLYNIYQEYGYLGHKESQLEALRLLYKVLQHRKHLEILKNHHINLFFKTLDIIHPIPEVTMVTALSQLATQLALNEQYEESAERYLDLLAILEDEGQIQPIRNTLHNATAALLLLKEYNGIDRNKDALTLCKRAVFFNSQNYDVQSEKSCSVSEGSENEPVISKKAKLELNMGDIFMELDSETKNESNTDENDDLNIECVHLDSSDSFRNVPHGQHSNNEVCLDSIHSALVSVWGDLVASILLSDCALGEDDFENSLLHLNRCLLILNNQQLLERSKSNSSISLLKTIDFIVSYIWLRKANSLMKRMSVENLDFESDIEHCFRNAHLRNPDDPQVEYHYLKYMLRSGKTAGLTVKKCPIDNIFRTMLFSNKSTERLAVWYIFRPTVTKEEYAHLIQQIKEMNSSQ